MVFRPDTFGKYVLLKRIAVGGMAEVFRAKTFGAEGFEKTVAIKRMLPHLSSDSQFVNMFINEAKLTASLTHANIAQIYDFGCIENMYFLSMEYVFGKDLADLIRMLRDKGLGAPIELACHVIIETLNGLDYAHRKTDAFGNPLNLIHRDTSPHNLIISYEGEVKIVDFGIAKAKSTTVQTTGGVLKGKYSYMSPEQAHGMPLDHRSDIFSLGICFYELLTLSKMFQGTSDLSVLEKVRETDFISPRQLNEAIPQELEDLLLKALEKNPNDRWDSAAQWREAIEDFLFKSSLHYSTAWLSGFMREIFTDDICREMQELGEEDEIGKKLKKKARNYASKQSLTDTIKFSVGEEEGDRNRRSEFTENRPPIREVSSGEFVVYEGDEEADNLDADVILEEPDDDDEDLSLLDTAIAASPLGRHSKPTDDEEEEEDLPFSESAPTFSQTLRSMDELPLMDEADDESMPTVELSRPMRANVGIPPRVRPGQSAEVINYDEDAFDNSKDYEDEDSGVSQITTMDERNQDSLKAAKPAIVDDEDFSMVTTRDEKSSSSVLARFNARKESGVVGINEHTGEAALDPMDFDGQQINLEQAMNIPQQDQLHEFDDAHETTQGDKKGVSSFSVVLTLLIALGIGGLVALWQVSFGDEGSSSTEKDGGTREPEMDGGLAIVVGKGDKRSAPTSDSALVDSKPSKADGGLGADASAERPAPKDEEKPDAAKIQNSKIAALTAPDHTSVDPKPDEKTGKERIKSSNASKTNNKKRRKRRHRRKRISSCPSKGFGTLNVGVSAGWAFVFVDGKEVRTTPLPNYKIRAGRHKIELKKGKNKILKRWNTCIRRRRKVTLIYQNN